MNFSVSNRAPGETGLYAARELHELLCSSGLAPAGVREAAGLRFVLETDPAQEEYSYTVEEKDGVIRLLGRTSAEVLLAVYLVLERMGFAFDSFGVHPPVAPDIEAVNGYRETVRPFVRLRGIRQHINFPMDISSYHLGEAQEYIRSLARMRMNAITFHSYEGMWHGDPGHFFYNIIHDLPDEDYLREVVEGKKKYVSPECEPLLGDWQAVADYAVGFLRDLMHTAKTAGMHVTMSVEPTGELDKLRKLLRDYPEIDELEIISPELGVFAPAEINYEQAIALAVRLFGRDVLEPDGTLAGLNPEGEVPPRLADTLEALAGALNIYRERGTLGRELPIRIGMYVLCRGSLFIVKRIMDRFLPPDMIRTFLPAHGTEAVVDAVRSMRFRAEDFQKTTLYSWIEFDGNMYLQQNSAGAIWHTMEYLRDFTGAPSVYSVCFNHWRTAENALPIAYSAAAAERLTPPETFFRALAARLGLDPGRFAAVMERAGRFDTFCRDRLFNIGFCFLPCWTMHPGIGWCDNWSEEDLASAIAECGALVEELAACDSGAAGEEGRALLELQSNRYRASAAHIRMIAEIVKIRPISGKSKDALTREKQDAIAELLAGADGFADEYLHTYAESVPDRGCQGQLVDYYRTMKGYLAYLHSFYLGAPAVETGENGYAPPPPDASSAQLGNADV